LISILNICFSAMKDIFLAINQFYISRLHSFTASNWKGHLCCHLSLLSSSFSIYHSIPLSLLRVCKKIGKPNKPRKPRKN
jgi:hypothetical protein